jgi:hypothetical protein
MGVSVSEKNEPVICAVIRAVLPSVLLSVLQDTLQYAPGRAYSGRKEKQVVDWKSLDKWSKGQARMLTMYLRDLGMSK